MLLSILLYLALLTEIWYFAYFIQGSGFFRHPLQVQADMHMVDGIKKDSCLHLWSFQQVHVYILCYMKIFANLLQSGWIHNITFSHLSVHLSYCIIIRTFFIRSTSSFTKHTFQNWSSDNTVNSLKTERKTKHL